jgi:hypothetical protein
MADQFESNARSAHPDSEVDDPLAELARIIGYERPTEATPTKDESSDLSEFDLEAELMRELDVPLAPSDEEIDSIEAEEALDVMLADTDFELEDGEISPDPAQPAFDDEQIEVAVENTPELDEADFMAVEGRSSGALLQAIENETRFARETGSIGDETGIDDDWMMTLDADDVDTGPDTEEREHADQDDQTNVAPATDVSPAPAAQVVAAQRLDAGDMLDDDVFADMARFELPAAQRTSPTETGQSARNVAPEAPYNGQRDAENASEADDAALDFEEYLSTELDVFEQEVAIGSSRDGVEPVEYVHVADSDAERDVETALDALNDSSLDDEVAVFDEAAEELLTAIGDAEEGRIHDAPSEVASHDLEDRWSLDSIEEAVAEELDEELDDMFGLPGRAVGTTADRADVPDEFDLDLEELLADSLDDDVDEDLVKEEEVVATALQTEQVMESDDWMAVSPAPRQSVSRDEMSEAFLGLAADIGGESPAIDPSAALSADASTRAGASEPAQSDWLDGFETSEQGSPQTDEPDYYFDAGLISEADETVEVVADIDVPVLHHDEPAPVEPEYDTDIEREFASIAEHSDAQSDGGSPDGVTLAAAEGWNRGTATPRAREVSDEYIALERELGVGVDENTHTYDEAYGTAFPGDDFDINNELAVDHSEAENRSRGPVLAFAVLGIALLAGVGAFGWSMLSGGEATTDGGPRIIRADKDPVKVLPENPGGVTVPNQDKAVYDRVAGGSGASTGQPALVNSAEEPVDVVQRTLDPEILPLEGRADFSEKSEERLSAETSGEDVATNVTAAPVVSPRKVRTMIVKPDGSIVAREVVEPETAPAVEAAQTEVSPETAIDPTEQVAQTAETAETAEQPAAEAVETVVEQAAETETPATEGTVAPVRVVTTQPIRPVANAPVPQGRPADQPVNVVGTVTQAGRVDAAPAAPQPVAVASAPAAAAPAAVASAPVANPGGYYVQIASQPTVEGAQSSWGTLSSRYSSVLGGQSVDIQRADIPGKGVFHRVRVPAGTRDQANALCSRYKAAGGSCFVSR